MFDFGRKPSRAPLWTILHENDQFEISAAEMVKAVVFTFFLPTVNLRRLQVKTYV